MRCLTWVPMIGLCALGCGGGSSGASDAREADTTRAAREAGAPGKETSETLWTLTAMRLEGEPHPLVDGPAITLAFGAADSAAGGDTASNDVGRVHGHGGVNRYSARLVHEPDGHHRWVGGVVATKMAGPPERMAQEQAFFRALERTDMMIVEKDGIVLEDGDGSVRLVFGVAE